jgi:hypothetical protein
MTSNWDGANCDLVMKELATGRAIAAFRPVWMAALRADLRTAARNIVTLRWVKGNSGGLLNIK